MNATTRSAPAVWALACLATAGCVSTSQVLEVGPNTYVITATADGLRSAAAARESAYQAGAERCRQSGKRFLLVDDTAAPTRMNIDTTITVRFKCLAETDPAYGAPAQ